MFEVGGGWSPKKEEIDRRFRPLRVVQGSYPGNPLVLQVGLSRDTECGLRRSGDGGGGFVRSGRLR